MDDVTFKSRLQSISPQELIKKPASKIETGALSFNEVLKGAINEVNDLQADADKIVSDLQIGKDIDIHDAMVALNKMDVSFKLLLEVRNKLLKAYEEVMRMQV